MTKNLPDCPLEKQWLLYVGRSGAWALVIALVCVTVDCSSVPRGTSGKPRKGLP